MERERENKIKVIGTGDGSNTMVSTRWNASYHSLRGALSESRHVYIEHGLAFMAARQKKIHLFEYGLGSGLNAALSWKFAEENQTRLQYTAAEKFPPGISELGSFAEVLEGEDLQCRLRSVHACRWGEQVFLSENFSIEKVSGDFEELSLPMADLVYFDVFSPAVQPELWTEHFLRKVFLHLKPGGCFVTYCASSGFRRIARKSGLQLDILPGAPGKREMTRLRSRCTG